MSGERIETKQRVIIERTADSGKVSQVWTSDIQNPSKKKRPQDIYIGPTDKLIAVIEAKEGRMRNIPLSVSDSIPGEK